MTQTLSFSIFRYGMGNLDMHRPKHLVFLLLGTGWGTWICIDPHVEFFYCSVGGGELRYVLTQTWSFSIARYGMGNLDMHKPKHLVFLVLGTGWGTWIYIDPHIEFFFFSVGGVGNLDIY